MTPHALHAPRDFTLGIGLPGDRRAAQAALQAFEDLRSTFLHVLRDLKGCEWLSALVRAAQEPVDLWLLRAPAYAALDGVDAERRQRRQQLRRGLETLFPDTEAAPQPLPF